MKNTTFRLKPFILLFSLMLVVSFCFDTTKEGLWNPAYLFWPLVFLIVFLSLRKSIIYSEDTILYVIMLTGILIKTAYVLYTAIYTRQHDVIDFGVGEGHAGYIEYIYFNNSLPQGDPREKWAFFQPPLHHIIAALWMKFCNKFTHVYRQLQENVQALTLFYTAAVEVFSLFICRELKLKKKGMIAALLIISIHPVFILMSGSINNDALSLVLSLACFYFLIRWYKEGGLFRIILIALTLGLSMLAKLSGGMIAPAVAFVFLLKLIREDKKGRLTCLLHYFIFAIIVFPLGIGWEIRNMISYGMPFNYIPPVGEILEKRDFISRFLDIRTNSIYPSMVAYNDPYDEYNIIVALFKTAIFGEYDFGRLMPAINAFALPLFITSVLLAMLALLSMILTLAKSVKDREFSIKRDNPADIKWTLFIYYITMLGAYFSFAFKSDNFSAQDFRYIAGVIVVQSLFLAMFRAEIEDKSLPARSIDVLCLGFGIFAVLVYIMLGFSVKAG